MSAKKSAPKKTKSTEVRRRDKSNLQTSRFHGVEETVFPLPPDRNDKGDKQPYHLTPETKEEWEKRLAARKTLTLEAFQIAYKNHHRRKVT